MCSFAILACHASLAENDCFGHWVQSKSPQAVQPHLGKCFDGIRRLEFGGDDPKSPDILAMVSAEGEKVPLGKNLKVRYPCLTLLGGIHPTLPPARHITRANTVDAEPS